MKQASSNKQSLIKISAKILNFINGIPFSLLYSGIGQILMFHRVLPSTKKERIWSNSYLEVNREFLENIILYYKKHKFEFISLDELHYRIENKIKLKKFVVFTFDDGYKDNLIYALPIMKKHNIPFTIYISTNFPDLKADLWWQKLEDKVLTNSKINFTVNNKTYNFNYSGITEKNRVYEEIHHIIKTTPEDFMAELSSSLFGNEYDEKFISNHVLTWEEIKYLSQQEIVTIGAHTVNHKMFSKLNLEEAVNEIVVSKKIIENNIQKEIIHFAYPYGGIDSFSKREIRILKENNFQTSVTTISKNVSKNDILKPFELPRIACGMSMSESTFDLIRHGVIPMLRNKGKI
jgi:peptidoglycan/xylan/chitin deacetylase (PgdA/CDA1 family)